MPTIDDKNIDENELLAAVRANLAEATEEEKKKDGEDAAVKVENPLDPEASQTDKDSQKDEESLSEDFKSDFDNLHYAHTNHAAMANSTHQDGRSYSQQSPMQRAEHEHSREVMATHGSTFIKNHGEVAHKHAVDAIHSAAKSFEARKAGNTDEAEKHADAASMSKHEAVKASEQHQSQPTSVQEHSVVDIKEILAGNDQLSEEFKEKAAIIFNTAVKMQVEAIASKLEEQFTEKKTALESSHEELKKTLEEKFASDFADATQKFEETLSEKIDGYFGALSEEWMNENELALEGGIQAELVESFIGGMRGLFEQHYVEMPEEKRDLFSEANQKVAELEKSLATQIAESTEAKTTLAKLQREKIIFESAHGMTELDASRFKTLMEDFEFDGEETFSKKAQTVKDSFFKTKAALNESKTAPVVEKPVQPQELVEETVIPVRETSATSMDLYVKHIKGQSA